MVFIEEIFLNNFEEFSKFLFKFNRRMSRRGKDFVD